MKKYGEFEIPWFSKFSSYMHAYVNSSCTFSNFHYSYSCMCTLFSSCGIELVSYIMVYFANIEVYCNMSELDGRRFTLG